MKTWTLRLRQTDKKLFEEIKVGKKVYETRAGTVRYRSVEVGDTLVFVCGKSKVSKKVTQKFLWPTVDAMTKEVNFKKIMPSVDSIKNMKKAYASYPGYIEKIRANGLLGFKLK